MQQRDSSQSIWRKQVQKHLQGISYSDAQRAQLRNALLNSTRASENVAPLLLNSKPFWRRFGADYIAVAFAAAAITFVFLMPSAPSGEVDSLAEFLSIPMMRSYPADFDLEGDPSALGAVMRDIFPADAEVVPFKAEFPGHLAVKFKPTEGRFFTWSGEPAVSIRLNIADLSHVSSSATGERGGSSVTNVIGGVGAPSHTATLYIVKLGGIAAQKFPKDRAVKRVVSRSGKERRVHVWRQGSFGYAVVQNSVAASGDFFPDSNSHD